MKKWLAVLLMVSFAAGISVAEDKSPWWKLGFGKDDENMEQQEPQRPPQHGQREGRESRLRKRHQMSEEQRAKVKAHFEEVQRLAEAARNEPDPAKKDAIVAKLRAKLTESAERMQAEFRKRIEKAEADLSKMKKRLEAGEKNKEKRIEDQLQKLLSGERPFMKGGGDKPRRKAPPAE